MRRGLLLLALAAGFGAAPALADAGTVDVVVTMKEPPLARAVAQSRALSATAKRSRLNLRSPTSAAHLSDLGARQDALAARIERTIPGAQVRWRYRIVLSGLAVTLPERHVPRLASLRGVAGVDRAARYTASSGSAASTTAAPAAAAGLTADGAGVKIAVLDEGVDHTHPFFNPAGYAYPPGYPKGNRSFTTPKVIAARAFPPRSPKWRYAARPFDPQYSEHGTHVAGIAAGNANTLATGRTPVSGVAPRAYIGNYKVLTTPSAGFGLNGNSPEIVAGIEAAVADGMDVINLSLGEPEVEPGRDLVARAIDAAVDAGVVASISAGNSGDVFGAGSIGSPGTAAKAITVAAASSRTSLAGFSSIGPTPRSLRLKPDLAAPGVDVLSSVPARRGLWAHFSGTSMAAPYVSGLAALLLERNPDWTPAQVKSALVQTATPVSAGPAKAGAGMADLARAVNPVLFADPTGVSFGLLPRGGAARRTVQLGDAGAGAGAWSVAVDAPGGGVTVTAPPTVAVPGALELAVSVAQEAAPATHTGFVTLTRGSDVRRIPYWLRVSARALARHRVTVLSRPGVYRGSTAGRPSLVGSYRFPEAGLTLAGPERVFRVRLRRPAANLGVVVLGQGRGVQVEPRITLAGDEDRMTGAAALPLDLNPWRRSYGSFRPVAGALLPRAAQYDIVFDSPRPGQAGSFRFRLWIGDTRPPRVRPLARSVRAGAPLRLAVSDPGGSGVDPRSLDARIDGRRVGATLRGGVVRVNTRGVAPGNRRLVLSVADFQETKNDENVSRILPNTRTFRMTVRVTR